METLFNWVTENTDENSLMVQNKEVRVMKMLLSPLHCKALESAAAAESAAVLKSSFQKDNQQRELASSSEGEKPFGNDTCRMETFPLQV